ncbi:MAG: hypothetical protein OXG83_02535 [Acidobacteria bacterium]|nr:hypothetical protein [Acidobacteriota bacterium]
MRKALPVALLAMVLSVGVSLAEPPDAATAAPTTINGHDRPNQHTVTDLTSALGGARSHSCRVNSVAGAILTAAGSATSNPTLIRVGMVLTTHSLTICV